MFVLTSPGGKKKKKKEILLLIFLFVNASLIQLLVVFNLNGVSLREI